MPLRWTWRLPHPLAQRGRLVRWLTAAAVLLCAVWGVSDAQAHPRLLGRFKITYYHVAHEREQGDWPLYADACRSIIAHTSEAFHRELSLEGTGRLRDGRLLNFSQRCACARPGFEGSRACYLVLDTRLYPWGRGAPHQEGPGFAALKPFRSVAVDPATVALGSVVFVPALQGKPAPGGGTLSGCFVAEDTGRLIQGRHLDLFAGKAEWGRTLLHGLSKKRVEVYHDPERCRSLAGGPALRAP